MKKIIFLEAQNVLQIRNAGSPFTSLEAVNNVKKLVKNENAFIVYLIDSSVSFFDEGATQSPELENAVIDSVVTSGHDDYQELWKYIRNPKNEIHSYVILYFNPTEKLKYYFPYNLVENNALLGFAEKNFIKAQNILQGKIDLNIANEKNEHEKDKNNNDALRENKLPELQNIQISRSPVEFSQIEYWDDPETKTQHFLKNELNLSSEKINTISFLMRSVITSESHYAIPLLRLFHGTKWLSVDEVFEFNYLFIREMATYDHDFNLLHWFINNTLPFPESLSHQGYHHNIMALCGKSGTEYLTRKVLALPVSERLAEIDKIVRMERALLEKDQEIVLADCLAAQYEKKRWFQNPSHDTPNFRTVETRFHLYKKEKQQKQPLENDEKLWIQEGLVLLLWKNLPKASSDDSANAQKEKTISLSSRLVDLRKKRVTN